MSEHHSSPLPKTPYNQELGPNMSVKWQRHDEKSFGVVIENPEIGRIFGTLYDHGSDASRSLYVDAFEAKESGKGYGKLLLQSLTNEGVKYGASSMRGHFTSPASLGAFAGVVGSDSLKFYSFDTRESVDITYAYALENPKAFIAEAPLGPSDS